MMAISSPEKPLVAPPTAKVRIVHITTVDLSLRYLLLNQLLSLKEHGYDVTAISSAGPDVPVIEEAGITHLAVPFTRRFTPIADLVTLMRLVKILRREQFTLVHTHTPKAGLLGQLAARMAGVPVVINTVHGFYFHSGMRRLTQRFYTTMERIAARCSDVLLSQNTEDIDAAVQRRICPLHRIKHLGNGIDLTRFDPTSVSTQAVQRLRRELGIAPDVPVVGYVGRLVREKGIPELFEAAQTILQRFPTAKFLFIGPVDHEKPDAITPQSAIQYGIDSACIFTGMRHDLPELFSLMNVLVLPSHREGYPRAPMEASAMGVPCVVTDIRGCREAVLPGRNGLLVPPKCPERLAEAVIEVLANPTMAETMGEEGRVLARTRFDERSVFDKIRMEYKRLLRSNGLNCSDSIDDLRRKPR